MINQTPNIKHCPQVGSNHITYTMCYTSVTYTIRIVKHFVYTACCVQCSLHCDIYSLDTKYFTLIPYNVTTYCIPCTVSCALYDIETYYNRYMMHTIYYMLDAVHYYIPYTRHYVLCGVDECNLQHTNLNSIIDSKSYRPHNVHHFPISCSI